MVYHALRCTIWCYQSLSFDRSFFYYMWVIFPIIIKCWLLCDHAIKQHKIVEYLGNQHQLKWKGDGFKIPKENKCQTKIPVGQNSCVTPACKRLLQCAKLVTFILWMFLMVSSVKEKFSNNTSKTPRKMYPFLHKFAFGISYRSITL